MRVQIPEKVNGKTIAANDIRDRITQLRHEKTRLRDTLSQIEQAVGGMPSGQDRQLADGCRQALDELENAIRQLTAAGQAVAQLDVTEEVLL